MIAPKLALNFLTATLDPRITFARSGNTATRINNFGYIETVNSNIARFDFDPITLLCKGLLIEEQRQNVVTYSNDFRVSWSFSNSSINANNFTGPDNSQTAQKLVCGTAINSTSLFTKTQAATIGVTYTCTVIAKAGEHGTIRVRMGASQIVSTYFNLVTGIVQAGSGTIKRLANGYYACSVTATATAAEVNPYVYTYPTGTTGAYTGNGVDGLYVWNVQIEPGAFPTSTILTGNSSATRNADVATITGGNFSSFWYSTRGGALVRALPSTVSGTCPLVQFDDGTANEIIALRGNTTNPELYIVDGGAPQAQIDAGTIAANTPYSLTGWWQQNFCAARLDAGTRVEDSSATIPTVTQMRIGSDGTNYLNGHIARINYYDQFSGQIYTRRKNKAVFSVI